MEIKHKRVFQPLALEIWGLQSVQTEYYRIAESINLYSVHRGVNRFQGLVMAFERLAPYSETGRNAVIGYTDLSDFILSGAAVSAHSLAEYNTKKQSPFIDKVLEWTVRCDELYAQIMEDEGNPSYPGVSAILKQASQHAEIMVISSSSNDTLNKDWGDAGLLPLITEVAGQEMGSKSHQLESALSGDFPPSKALMIGDAPGDLDAARANGILFYPIIPGAEAQSWERFETEAIERFYEGSYAGDYQNELLSNFQKTLRPNDPWPSNKRGVSESLINES